MPNYKVTTAMFDIKPVDETGQVDVERIYNVKTVVDLTNQKPAKSGHLASINLMRRPGSSPDTFHYMLFKNQVNTPVDISDSVEMGGIEPPSSQVTIRSSHQAIPTVKQSYQEKLISQDELEKYLNSELDIKKEIRSVGGKAIRKEKKGKLRVKPIFASQKSAKLPTSQVVPTCDVPTQLEDYQIILSQINQRIAQGDDVFIGEPRKIDPFDYWKSDMLLTRSDILRTSDLETLPETETWTTQYTQEANNKTRLHKINETHKIHKIYRLSLSLVCRLAKFFNPPNFNWRKILTSVVIAGFIVLATVLFGRYGVSVKNEIIKESNSAVASLEQANDNLQALDFKTASDNFSEAYQKFSKAGDTLNLMGASITSLFTELPGFDLLDKLGASKLRSAKNLVEAGRLLAEAGKSMSEAVNSLARTGKILDIGTSDVPRTPDVINMFGDLKKSLLFSGRNLAKAKALLSDVSTDVLPEDKKEVFEEFQSKLPEFESIVSDAVEYTEFLERFLGFGLATSDSRGTSDVRYLVLFQNNSELRPTGGFPGTYAVVTFKNGKLSDLKVDDVYNLDGQLKENYIPPVQLQHITPTWGMRDTNWFIDFSVSAQKVMEFFKKGAGYEVDGVLTMNPEIISEILKVVGPIEMPEYDAIVNDENFMTTLQEEVEYGENRQQPKKIVMDMAPKLLEKINSADSGQWLDIFNMIMSRLDKKDILMYFKDLSLENFVAKKGFGGLVKNTSGDYLMVTLSNVKGAKTDRVTDNFFGLNSKFEIRNSKPVVIHKLTIMRQHNGGSTDYGFYNKQNPAYVRVLVPEGAKLISVSGNSSPSFKPLVNYSEGGFKVDSDLQRLEAGFDFDEENNAGIYKESGKTGFAFWLIADPGEQKTVELEYSVPFDYTQGKPYDIYIQKQPGLEVDNFEFNIGGSYIYSGELDNDLGFKIDH